MAGNVLEIPSVYNQGGGYGSAADYLASLNQNVPDVGGGGLDLSSLLGQGGGGGLGSLLGGQGGLGALSPLGGILQGIQGLSQGGVGGDISGASGLAGGALSLIPGIGTVLGPVVSGLGNLVGSLIPQGLPANAKPNMYASYLQGQGGLPADLGSLISAAQQQAGSGSGVLSQSGANAFNPNFMATLLEALTGQNLGATDASGRQTFTAPATGNVKQPVSLSFLPESSLMSSAPMAGLSAYGFTPAQLASPAAQKIIEQATNYGMVGTGQGLGTQKVAQYLPKVAQALISAGIKPGASDGTGTTTTGQGGTGSGGSTGTGGSSNNTLDLTSLLKLIQSGGNITVNTGGEGGSSISLPASSLLNLLGGSSGVTQQANPQQTVNVNAPKPQPYIKSGVSYSGLGFAKPSQLPTITPLDLSSVSGAQG